MTPPMFRAPSDAPRSGRLTLDGPEGHHAADVRRLRDGEAVWLTDGRGTRWHGSVANVRRGALDVDISEVVEIDHEPPRIIAVQALVKGGRDEAAVEALTELGVDEVIGWSAARSVARWTDRTSAKWQSVADAAARQARRVWWPTITGPATTADVAERIRATDLAIVFHEDAVMSLNEIERSEVREVLFVVGPEGGIGADDELGALVAAGARPIRLGSEILRSSTAAVAALGAILSRTRW